MNPFERQNYSMQLLFAKSAHGIKFSKNELNAINSLDRE